MKIVMPKAEILPRMSPLKKIELCARVAYKSENKITEDSAERFCRKLLELGHTSVLEHARVEVPWTRAAMLLKAVHARSSNEQPYGWTSRRGWVLDTPQGEEIRLTANGRDLIDYMQCPLEDFDSLEEADDYMSVRFTCDRAIANELVRHRQMSFTQESSRYVNYKEGVEFILPVPFDWADLSGDPHEIPDAFADPRYQAWYFVCERAEGAYCDLIAEGCTPQEARDVLPLSTKTELIMTGMYTQWEDVFKLRLDKAAHPQMRHLMNLLVNLPEFPKDKIHLEGKIEEAETKRR